MKTLKDGRYLMDMNKKLGSGNFADVYQAKDTHQNNEIVAIKVIQNKKINQYGEKLKRAIEKEIEVMQELTKFANPYLLRFIDCFESPNNKYLVMEFCDGGTFQDVLTKKGKLPENEALEVAYHLVLGLSALEESGISHRDLKPENIFIQKDIYKIGDFGFATQASKFQTSLGT